ncbi:MAG: putative selenoprotein [Magnetococcales bacterium]|nr:putative selenoprotein [Magnetococcales bacterium]
MRQRLRHYWALFSKAARLVVGMPDYENYVQHQRQHHPEQPVMTLAAFVQERQEARYGGRGGRPGRCC